MTFNVITLFPEFFKPYLAGSIMGRAVQRKLFNVNFYNLRDFSSDRKHKRVDDKVYGGGPGMVLKLEPLIKAISSLKLKVKSSKLKVILFTPTGKQFDNKIAARFAKNYDNLVLICGRYEGVDARLKSVLKTLKLPILELSVGPYTLSGGELPAIVVIDAISRHIPGVLGKEESIEENRLGVGVPAYTRPEVFIYKKKKYSVPKVLKSGNHKAIMCWRMSHRKLS